MLSRVGSYSLQETTTGGLVQVSVGLHEDLAGLLVLQTTVAHLGAPVLEADLGHGVGEEVSAVFRRRPSPCRCGVSCRKSPTAFRPVVRILERSRLMVRSDRSSFWKSSTQKPSPASRKHLRDGEAGLAMRLAQFLALGIPELDRRQPSPRHAEV